MLLTQLLQPGGESRRWTVGELVERLKNLGVCASRASVTAALVELGLELELSGLGALAPLGTGDRMDPRGRKGGVSKRRVGEILQMDAARYLEDLSSQGLIYCDPSRELNFGGRRQRPCLLWV